MRKMVMFLVLACLSFAPQVYAAGPKEVAKIMAFIQHDPRTLKIDNEFRYGVPGTISSAQREIARANLTLRNGQHVEVTLLKDSDAQEATGIMVEQFLKDGNGMPAGLIVYVDPNADADADAFFAIPPADLNATFGDLENALNEYDQLLDNVLAALKSV